MEKWYEENSNASSILSSRIRLARNFSERPFPKGANDDERLEMIDKTAKTLAQYKGADPLSMNLLDSIDRVSRQALVDKHLISPNLAAEKRPACVFISRSEKTSLMVMEEDHIRIQAIEAGDNITKAYERASAFDDLLDEEIGYAFDGQWGYLTSCPTNAGTGLRASYMLHLPYLEAMGQISNIASSIGKFGYTIRGTFGEGSGSYGSVYQISNQITMGMTEEDILRSIQSLAGEIVEKERYLREREVAGNPLGAEDRVWRVYGLLTNARQMTEKEAITNLSLLKTGIMAGIIDQSLPNIYDLIVHIRTATLSKNEGITDMAEVPAARAAYLRKKLAG